MEEKAGLRADDICDDFQYTGVGTWFSDMSRWDKNNNSNNGKHFLNLDICQPKYVRILTDLTLWKAYEPE